MARSLWTVLVWLACLLPASLAGCGDNSRPSADLSLSATSLSLAAGDTTTLTLTGAGTAAVAWSSGDPSIATVTGDASSATVRAVAPGSTTITAAVGDSQVSVPITVNQARLISIGITPPSPTVAHGIVVQLSAFGTYSDQTVKDITPDATWTSSDGAIASVDGNGAVTGGDPGSATITAALGNVTATAAITVTSATLASIAITPPDPSLPLLYSTQLAATGTFSDNTTADLTSQVIWASAMTNVATVSAAGIVTTKTSGSSVITAALGNVTGTTTVTVTTATLQTIAVTPSTASLAIGVTQQYAATGTYSDTTTHDLTSQVTWSATGTAATISATGLATAAVAGTSTITATLGAISGSTTVAVTPAAIISIAIDPPNPTVSLNGTTQFAATATLSDNTTATITDAVAWSVDAHASISNAAGSKGLATGTSLGTAAITATIMTSAGPVSGTTHLTVVQRQLMSIAIEPADSTVPGNWSLQLTATGTYDDTTTANLTNDVTWDSDDHSLVTVSNAADKGIATTTTTAGTATITATLAGVTGSTTLTVSAKTLQAITVDPATITLSNGAVQQFTATGVFSDNSSLDMTELVTWASSTESVATISNASATAGLATTHDLGTSQISATFLGTTGTAQLVVATRTLQSISITPSAATTGVNLTVQFTAQGTYDDNSTADLTNDVTWASSTGAATISNAAATHGLATGVAVGPTDITASLDGVTSSPSVLAVATLTSIAVTPGAVSVPKGLTQAFTATATFDNNDTADITTSVTWASADITVATISNTAGSIGVAKAIAASSSSTISATFGSTMGTANLTATAAVVQSIALSSTSVRVSIGSTVNLVATGTFSDGTTSNVTNTATWTSSDATTASVTTANSRGQVSGVAIGGPVTITAAITVGATTVSATAQATVVGLDVVSIGPSEGITGVKPNAPLYIAFSHAVTPASITVQAADDETCTGSVQVSSDDFASCVGLGAVTVNGAVVSIAAEASGYTKSATYKVRVTTAVTSTATGTPSLGATVTQTNGWMIGNPPACTTPIVISQVYGGGGNTGATYNADFVELHNRSNLPESLAGLALQYASVNGTTWNNLLVLPNATIPAGGYFLVGLAGGANGTALPTPDFTGTINMSATAGKIALTTTITQLPSVACPLEYTLDFVGFGGTTATTLNCTEGGTSAATSAPALSATISAIRGGNGCNDTDVNNADFTQASGAAIVPRNSATSPLVCSGSCAP